MSEIYYIDTERKKRNTAGAKAPDDIAELCRRCGYRRIAMPLFPSSKPKLMQKLWLLTVCVYRWLEVMKLLPEGCIVLYQHPQYGIRVAEKMISFIKKRKKCRFICIIHDLESLRGGISGVIKENKRRNEVADNILLRHMDCLICHNERMRQYLIANGFEPSVLINLEVFDYLCNCERLHPPKQSTPSVAIAGNLAAGKSGYIYDICRDGRNPNLEIHLYGNNFLNKYQSGKMMYHGSFDPDDLPAQLVGDFGIVWDGFSAKTCEGNTGDYLKYNNPHKTSLYLASGMPVIVWSKAAIADFVLNNRVGIAVDSLYEVETAIRAISTEEYDAMCQRTYEIGKKLRDGFYTKQALNKAIKAIQ